MMWARENKTVDEPREYHEDQVSLYERVISNIPGLASTKLIDKETYLWQLLEYVDAMISGDDIQQIASYNYSSKTAQKALKELSQSIQVDLLSYYREKRRELKDEIATLEGKKQEYTQCVESLKENRETLESEVTALDSKLAEIKGKLETLRINGLTQVEEEIKAKKRELISELDLLRKESKALQEANEKIKKSISTYNKTTMALLADGEVTWETVSRKDAIYQVTPENVQDYIGNVKKAYMTKMGISQEECDIDFTLNSPSLEMFAHLLKSSFYEYSDWAVSSIIDETWLTYSYANKAQVLKETLSNIKMPKITKKSLTVNGSQTVSNGNIESALRDLYLQRLLIESITRERILEAELNTMIQLLRQYVPAQFDFNTLITTYETIDPKIRQLLTNGELIDSSINQDGFHV